jgi:hypothetical protein
MGFVTEVDRTSNASKIIFGLPTAPATPQLESTSDSDPQKTQYNKSCVPTLKRAWFEGVKRTIGLKFTPTTEEQPYELAQSFQAITFMEPFKPFSLEELRLADYEELNKTKSASDANSGLPTAPPTPQPDDKENSSLSLQKFSFGNSSEKEVRAAKSTSLSGSKFPEIETSKDKSSELSLPLRPSAEATVKTVQSNLNASHQETQEKIAQPTPAGSSVLSDGKDASTSRSFFGLSSATKIQPLSTSPSLSSSVPTTQSTTGTPSDSVPTTSETSANEKPISWFPSLTPPAQDSNTANTTSLFTSLPKTTIAANFSFSKVSEAESTKEPTNSTVKDTHEKEAKAASASTQPAHKVETKGQSSQNSSLFVTPSTATINVSNLGKTSNTAPRSTPAPFKFNTNPSLFPPEFKSKMSTFGTTMEPSGERQKYMQLHHTKDNKTSGADEQLRTTPLISLEVKETSEARYNKTTMFPQYAFLGCRIPESSSLEDTTPTTPTAMQNIFSSSSSVQGEPEPVLLNTNTPWSAFICGSQGSGKSYTLSAMIENCLYPSPSIGKLPKPLAGIVFHNSTVSMHNICEAAHLVSLGVKVNVLVSRSNFHALSDIYKSAVGVKHEKQLNIQPLVLQSHHLTAERMHRLMAFQEGETTVPLYMEVIMRILREMAITGAPFSYSTFKANLDNEGLQPGQKVMMEMRLNLLESFLDPSCVKPTNRTSNRKADLFTTSPGTLTIVDLSDPFLDSSTTCTLFSILLDVFLTARPTSGLLVCLDEAHKFMKNTPAAETFTENLLTVIREQRHNACRIVIATQEPTISPKLLDLCSMTFVHRFTSPDWLSTLRGHLAGASDLVTRGLGDGDKKLGAASLFEKIIELDVGESLLFAPSAVLEEEEGKVKKLGVQCVKFKTRKRLGVDGGQSVLAVRE